MLSFQNSTALLALLLILPLVALPFIGRGVRGRGAQFWFALIVRALILLAMIFGLAGAQFIQPVNNTTVVFVVDHSDSVSSSERARAENFMRDALTTMRAGDRAAIVVFGENALVERLASEENTLAPIASIPRTARTNLASALRLALALLPDETNKRIVILSDGLQNVGRAEELMDLAAARGVQVDFVALNVPQGQSEVVLDALDAPASVRQGQQFEIVAVIAAMNYIAFAQRNNTTPGSATVRLFGDGKLLATQQVTLQQGTTRVAFSVKAEDAGFKRYTAELEAAQDTLKQNNTAAAFTVVQGPPHVLVVASAVEDANNLAAALQSAKVVVERVAPADVPGDLAALANYDAVFLVNVPAQALPFDAMRQLPAYVRDLGRGLVMIGGADAFGAGGYLRTPIEKALPVDMDVRAQEKKPNLAIAFVIDKSGSMGQCHCNNPDAQPGTYQRVESGLAKVEIAKNAVMQAARVLGRADYAGVVLFDANAHWAFREQPLTSMEDLQEKIGGASANGSTNIMAGLREAVDALKGVSAKFKHVVLLTDGWSRSGQYDELVAEMKKDNITLSIVAAGAGSAPYLEGLAKSAAGRYFAARFGRDAFARAARIQRHDAQSDRARFAAHRARRSVARDVAIWFGTRGGMDFGLERAVGDGLGRVERIQHLCRAIDELGFAAAERRGFANRVCVGWRADYFASRLYGFKRTTARRARNASANYRARRQHANSEIESERAGHVSRPAQRGHAGRLSRANYAARCTRESRRQRDDGAGRSVLTRIQVCQSGCERFADARACDKWTRARRSRAGVHAVRAARLAHAADLGISAARRRVIVSARRCRAPFAPCAFGFGACACDITRAPLRASHRIGTARVGGIV
ncbi:MAG: VWA domain-containing protein [Chloroflexi bacterium]|nr:VWA domain-containing protein [Chloroflexota bacterium]